MNNKPVDNELDELLDEYYPKGTVVANDNVDDEKAHTMTLVLEHRRDTFKARLLQWGTRQRVDELESITGFSKVGGVYTKAGVDTTKPNWQPISTQERKEKLQASLKYGGDRNKCLDCGKKLPDDYPFTYCDNDWGKHHPNPTKETK